MPNKEAEQLEQIDGGNVFFPPISSVEEYLLNELGNMFNFGSPSPNGTNLLEVYPPDDLYLEPGANYPTQNPSDSAKWLIPTQYLETPEKDSDVIRELTPTPDEVAAYNRRFREYHLAKLGLNSNGNPGNQQDPNLLSSFLSKKRRLEEALNKKITEDSTKPHYNKGPKL